MKLCLNMIVKNESGRIERALRSVAPFITSWVIVDTGSTDDTKEKITEFFRVHGIPGEIREEPFIDWAQARNAALNWARKLSFAYEPDYILLMDADMELRVHDVRRFMVDREGPNYEMFQQAGSVVYTNSRLINARAAGQYRGVTHEYLDIPTAGVVERDVADFYDHADGANRPEKFKRDIRLLKMGLKQEPNNERYMFYLANSYRDAGKPEDAIKWYDRRIAAGGWDEEVFQAAVYKAHAYKDIGKEAEFVAGLWKAYSMRPSRAEPLYDLAKYYREKPDMQAAGLAAAETGLSIPMSKDKLFVNEFVYEAGLRDEVAVCAYYVPHKFMEGYKMASEQALDPKYGNSREAARRHLYHYVFPLQKLCPSFEWKTLDFQAPEHWAAMNPSVTNHGRGLVVNVRCVNYRMDEEGRYLIRNTETGEVNAEQPISTRNFVLNMDANPFGVPIACAEALVQDDLPKEFPLVVGFEDVRLISTTDGLFASACVRQIHPDGNCEQVLSKLIPTMMEGRNVLLHRQVQRMLRMPRATEKNWAPINSASPSSKVKFMHRPGHVIDLKGNDVVKYKYDRAVDHISGSSQLIEFDDGYLAVTHEARTIPGSHKRWYMHRFIQYYPDLSIRRISLPFVFNEKVIEFCAGLAWHPNSHELVISYGYKDEEARIATVRADEVENLLWKQS